MAIFIRALPDITSGPEVQQIYKIRTVRKQEVFLTGRRTFNAVKERKNIQKSEKNQNHLFFTFLNCYLLSTPNLCPGTLSYENL